MSKHARGKLPGSALVTAAVVLVAGLSSGCAPGDIALEGKVFDALGAATGINATQKEAKVAPRAGIVIPPRLDNLPAPGETASVPDGAIADIRDHDRTKVVDKSKLEAAHREFCEKNYVLPKQRGDQSVDDVQGPLGYCRPSALTAMQKWNKSE